MGELTGGFLMAGGYNVRELYPDLFEGVDPAIAKRVASNFGSDAHEGFEASRRDVELSLLRATGKITREQFREIALAELRPGTNVES